MDKSKKIKVMHFVSGLISGGVEEMLYNYCKFMDNEKYEFVVVYQHEPIESCINKIKSIGCRTIRITSRSENFVNNIKDSIRIIEQEKPDIVHAHMNLMNFCALYSAKKCGVRVRISHSHIAEKDKNFLYRGVAFFLKGLSIKYATNLFACGMEAGEYFYGKKRMYDETVTIINNAIDLDYFIIDNQTKKENREECGLDGKLVIGHIGRFTYQKNHERLINIFRSVISKNKDAVLLLVGCGELEKKIRKKTYEMGLEEKVIFYGTTRDMRKVYSLFDVFVLPSYFEGLPVVSIEVQAANIPAILSSKVDKSCKVTEAIQFVDLEESDEEWANRIIDFSKNFKPVNLSNLYKLYDIKSKASILDECYSLMLKNI